MFRDTGPAELFGTRNGRYSRWGSGCMCDSDRLIGSRGGAVCVAASAEECEGSGSLRKSRRCDASGELPIESRTFGPQEGEDEAKARERI